MDAIRLFTFCVSVVTIILSLYNLYLVVRKWDYYHDFGRKIVINKNTKEVIAYFDSADTCLIKNDYEVITLGNKKAKFETKDDDNFYIGQE